LSERAELVIHLVVGRETTVLTQISPSAVRPTLLWEEAQASSDTPPLWTAAQALAVHHRVGQITTGVLAQQVKATPVAVPELGLWAVRATKRLAEAEAEKALLVHRARLEPVLMVGTAESD
jgi:hypothetical protein